MEYLKFPKPEYLEHFVNYISFKMDQYLHKKPTPDFEKMNWQLKEACMIILNSLGPTIDRFKHIRTYSIIEEDKLDEFLDLQCVIEPHLKDYIMPELKSDVCFLKLRAC